MFVVVVVVAVVLFFGGRDGVTRDGLSYLSVGEGFNNRILMVASCFWYWD